MAKGHFLSGVAAGLLTAPLALELTTSGPATPAAIVTRTVAYSAVVGIGALWPDIDHPPAFISKVAGPVSWLLNKLFMWISHVVYQATRTEKDRPEAIHRTFTHTNFGTLLTGGAVYAGLIAGHVALAPMWALAFTVGCLCHIWFIGDACTLSGVPHPLCPLVVMDGKRWATVGFPRWMRFRAGGVRKGEKVKVPFSDKHVVLTRKPMFTGERIATSVFAVLTGGLGALTLIAYGAPWWTPVVTLLGVSR
jgi:membrane-bound metal-dependent hydrolase YbcI (DUF457 family)